MLFSEERVRSVGASKLATATITIQISWLLIENNNEITYLGQYFIFLPFCVHLRILVYSGVFCCTLRREF
jgi:hypothetical protein